MSNEHDDAVETLTIEIYDDTKYLTASNCREAAEAVLAAGYRKLPTP